MQCVEWHYPSGALYALLEEGRRRYFYETGQLKTVEEYLQSVLHGTSILYWPNGVVKRQSHFSYGQRHGSDQMWDERGVLRDEGMYERGEPIGTHRRWGRTGMLIEEAVFTGQGQCHCKRWDAEGQLCYEGS